MKVLYTTDYGAGWSTWNSSNLEVAKYMATHLGVIKAVEDRIKEIESMETFTERYYADILDEYHPAIQDMEMEILNKFGIEVYTGGCKNLSVHETDNPVEILDGHDGKEEIKEIYLHDRLIIFP